MANLQSGEAGQNFCHPVSQTCVLASVRPHIFLTAAFAMGVLLSADPPTNAGLTADEIMARVAVNQDLAERARTAFVYRQNVAIRLRDNHGKLVREEISDYQVTPHARHTRKELVHFSGHHLDHGSMVSYDQSGQENDGFRNEADSELAHEMRDELTDDDKSKDGIDSGLFPLTAKEQRKYRFALKGEDKFQGADVYRVFFEPNHKVEDTCWKGDALISKADFQPLLVTTKLAQKIPLLVRTTLGTDLQGLGFSVQYQKFDDGVWFPVSYGTEFRIHVLFAVYSRHITISMVNSDFRRADVKSSVEFDRVQ